MNLLQVKPTQLEETVKIVLPIIETIKWPIVVIVLALIFFNSIKSAIKKRFKIKLWGTEIDTTNEAQTQQESGNKDLSDIDKATAFFSEIVINYFRGLVISESGIQSSETDAKKLETVTKYATIFYIKYYFEDLYRTIWGSQLQMLLYLNTIQSEGDTYENLKAFYDKAVEAHTAAYENYLYKDYFKFLLDFKLITTKDDRYVISVTGADFVRYIPSVGKNYNRPY